MINKIDRTLTMLIKKKKEREREKEEKILTAESEKKGHITKVPLKY